MAHDPLLSDFVTLITTICHVAKIRF